MLLRHSAHILPPRDDWCKADGRYGSSLPATSVVVCFHNEAWSVLLRTVHSILDRSPSHLLGKQSFRPRDWNYFLFLDEIILVDDASTMSHLKEELETYMASYPKVKVIRAPERVGLIRARLLGAQYVKAPVITYLDSHCECTQGWLEPLLDRIGRNQVQFRTVYSTLIGRDPTVLSSYWSRASECCWGQQSYAIKNQLVASKASSVGLCDIRIVGLPLSSHLL